MTCLVCVPKFQEVKKYIIKFGTLWLDLTFSLQWSSTLLIIPTSLFKFQILCKSFMHTCNTLHIGHTVLIHYCLTVAHVLDGLIAHIIKQCGTKLQLNSSTDERGGAASEAGKASHELQPSQAAHNHDNPEWHPPRQRHTPNQWKH